ncbi:hypothetical protein ACQ46_gp255 [Citrobacter phage Moon]|uniref:Uncharacterized protein n=1 Tax=Citrobacter phage Moon TaxID=1540095 RepID=A0A0A0YPB8_9CAUD|nr:hypothetical protein ACQ46_gp255 [Citrobacter phage Moon]AIX12169.1 hypothetical protein CPT_Moon198 [Citrobacter phage Moon]
MTNFYEQITESQLFVTDMLDHMMYESKFSPAAHGVNKWLPVNEFIKRLSPFDAKSQNLADKNAWVIIRQVLATRFAVEIDHIDSGIPLIIEVGDKNQFEIYITAWGLTKARVVPSDL